MKRFLTVACLSLLAFALMSGSGQAQDIPPYPSPYGGNTTLFSGDRRTVGVAAGPTFGNGYYHSGWPYGPRIAPAWGYAGLGGGPYVGYPFGYYSGRAGSNWSNGLSLYGPPVPIYGPVPGVFGNNDLVRQWQAVPSAGLPFGYFGIYASSPRPRPLTVSVWPVVESLPARTVVAPNPTKPGGCLTLSVKVPQPAAEVFVDGVKTGQTGTDRIFESPVLEGGKEFRYEITARWMERGAIREAKRIATGTPGEVVRIDFTAPEVFAAGR